jgi:YidC/Oxa1 family membrane protein insertase
MEKRLLLFFAVTFLIVYTWPRLFPPPTPPSVPAPVSTESEPAEAQFEDAVATAADEVEDAQVETTTATAAAERREAEAEEQVVIETEVLRLQFSNRGGRLESAKLLGYRDSSGEAYEMVDTEAAKHLGVYPLSVRLESAARSEQLAKALFVVESAGARRIVGDESTEVTFVWSDESGLEATKRFRFTARDFGFDAEVSVRVGGKEVAKQIIWGPGLGLERKSSAYVFEEKGVVLAREEAVLLAASDLEEPDSILGVDAAGVASHYFAGLILPRGSGLYAARLSTANVPPPVLTEEEAAETKKSAKKAHDVMIAALEGPREPAEFHVFVGPKQLEVLEALRPGLSGIIEFGWLRYPALLLRAGLVWIYDFVGNYGWAIVLLTVLINVALVPLKHYSFVSMRRMQKLAPQIQKIRDRYKKVKPTDPRYQHMNQELMDLYKEHNVSPVSGCLPMLLMIPFFFAFYKLLMTSIELRQAPFIGWIADLSLHDPYFVLPVLMGGTQVVIQRMTPQTSADPIQAKLMSVMPIVFTIFLALAPAGLVLYWFSNNLVSMGQQLVTNRLLADEDEEAKPKAKNKGKKND